MSGSDKRQYPRADLVFQLEFGVDESARDVAVTKDLSGGGVSFLTPVEYEPGTMLNLTFSLQGLPGVITASTRVTRSWLEDGSVYTAVEFVIIDQNDRVIIMDFIESYLREIAGNPG